MAFWFVRYRRDLDRVTFLDVALPWRWERCLVARGDQYLETARRLARQHNQREALALARIGLARSPANRDGRLLLAQLFMAAGRPSFARQSLLEGLQFHSADALFAQRLLGLLLDQEEDDLVVALAVDHLRRLPAAADAAGVFALAAATASHLRGRYDQAEDFLHKIPRLAGSREGRLLLAKIENDRGYPELALLQLQQLTAEFPRDNDVHRELVAHLRQRGRPDEARRASVAFQIAQPTFAAPRIELLQAYREIGYEQRARREIEALLAEFGRDAGALLALADCAANAGDVALVRRIEAHAEGQRWPVAPFALLGIEAAIVARDYHGALAAARAALADRQDWTVGQLALFDSLQAIAHVGLDDVGNARPLLLKFLSQPNLRAANLLAVANRLAVLEAPELARQTLLRAVDGDHPSQAALARLLELDLILNRVDELPAHVQKFVRMRRPSPAILRVVQHKLGSDLFLFSPDAPKALQAVYRTLYPPTAAL